MNKHSRLFKVLAAKKPVALDRAFHQAHEEVFEHTDCLTCANCCMTTSPVFTHRDIDRIAAFTGQKPSQIVDRFLRLDEDADYVLQHSPCVFLAEDNMCSVYEARPKACREYPHTNRKNMHQILKLTEKNAAICPAVDNILLRIREAIK